MKPVLMNTYTGLSVDPLELAPWQVRPEDVAHALSMLCRGCGHVRTFYSVAQHCLNCMREARSRGWSQRMQLACLVHDASEAYVSDIITPVKHRVSGYCDIEDNIEAAILERFGLGDLTEDERALAKDIDTALFTNEFAALVEGWDGEASPLASVPDLTERPHTEVEAEWLDAFRELSIRTTIA